MREGWEGEKMVVEVITASRGQLIRVEFREGWGSSRSHSDASSQFPRGTGPFPHRHTIHWSYFEGDGAAVATETS